MRQLRNRVETNDAWQTRLAIACWLGLFTVVFACPFSANGQEKATTIDGRDEAKRDIDFRRDVAPVLSRRCLSCHNTKQMKGDFQLHTEQLLSDSGFVEAGDSAASHLVDVIESQDGQAPKMPKASDPLKPAEVDAIRRWIDDGAVWPDGYTIEPIVVTDRDWWSLRPLSQVDPPPARDEIARSWIRTPIDAFVYQRLRDRGLSPSREADRLTLIRRVYFDLIGLPPSPQNVQSFLADKQPGAYDRLVDLLLNSEQYGERWARHWLDVVHYADTHGYDKDKQRPNAWPYRDYVIRALNADKPYSRFVKEQLAGDALWPASIDGPVATGFIAAGPWDFIGHAEVPETKLDGRVARNLDRDNMVTSAMNTFCSLTIQCARCHNHKLDPVTMVDYYRMQAVFASIDRADRPYDVDPNTAKHRANLERQRDKLKLGLVEVEQVVEGKLTPQIRKLDKDIAAIRSLAAQQSGASPKDRSNAYGYHSQVAKNVNVKKWVQVDLGRVAKIDHVFLFSANEYGFADFGFPDAFYVEIANSSDFADATVIADYRNTAFIRPAASGIHISAESVQGRYVRVTATKLWSRRRRGQPLTNDWIFALGEMAIVIDGVAVKPARVESLDSIEAAPRWAKRNLIDGVYGAQSLRKRLAETLKKDAPKKREPGANEPPSLEDLLSLSRGAESQSKLQEKLRELAATRELAMLAAVGKTTLAQLAKVKADLAASEKEVATLPKPAKVYAGVVHRGTGSFRGRHGLGPRTIQVLHRGDLKQPGKTVGPGAVPFVPTIPARFEIADDEPEWKRRAALAEWIVHRDNPLTWRSIVNRIWLYHFGSGLVDTPNDFGHGGDAPTHPQLLDWLAIQFRDQGQSMKSLHRMILKSSVYRQVVENDDKKQAIDSENRLYWRMHRRRLTAEEIRDTILAVAGKLNPAKGGPGFQDFAIEHPQHSPHYEYDQYDPTDASTHRRAIYRFIVRSQPQPFMDTLDCADPSTSVPKRGETLTSLQALALLNNRFVVAMSSQFAKRLAAEEDILADQVALAVHLALSREATPSEITLLSKYASEHGLENMCRLILNLNEFVFVD